MNDSTAGNHGNTVEKADDVIAIPLPTSGSRYAPVTTMTRPVIVQTMIVSMKGSSSATIPSRTGSSVRAAEWMIAADPVPASLLKAARRKPWINAPKNPPAPACHEKASDTMVPTAAPSESM